MDQNTPIGRKPSVLLSYAISILGIFLLWLLQHDPTTVLLHRLYRLLWQHDGLAGPLISATAMKIFRGKRVGTIYGAISRIGLGIRLLERRPDPRRPRVTIRCSPSHLRTLCSGWFPSWLYPP